MTWTKILADFVSRAPWWGGDLQTIRNQVMRDSPDLSAWPVQRLSFTLPDGSGDQMLGALQIPEGARRPLALLLHGLTGCEDSVYMRATAGMLLGAGYPVLRLNQRGSGPSRETCRGFTHAGRSEDVGAVLGQIPGLLPKAVTQRGVVAVGFSLGGNILLKHLGEAGSDVKVLGAASISAPIDLASASKRFLARRNWIYHHWLLRRIKIAATTSAATLTDGELSAIKAAPTVRDFDDQFLGPHHGFEGADDYYAHCSAAPRLGDIAVPTLLIHARNDPWIPAEAYERIPTSPKLWLQLLDAGGHLGFHDRLGRPAWHDRCTLAFMETLSV